MRKTPSPLFGYYLHAMYFSTIHGGKLYIFIRCQATKNQWWFVHGYFGASGWGRVGSYAHYNHTWWGFFQVWWSWFPYPWSWISSGLNFESNTIPCMWYTIFHLLKINKIIWCIQRLYVRYCSLSSSATCRNLGIPRQPAPNSLSAPRVRRVDWKLRLMVMVHPWMMKQLRWQKTNLSC